MISCGDLVVDCADVIHLRLDLPVSGLNLLNPSDVPIQRSPFGATWMDRICISTNRCLIFGIIPEMTEGFGQQDQTD